MNNNTPSGAISLDELNNMPGMEMPAGPSPLNNIATEPTPVTTATPIATVSTPAMSTTPVTPNISAAPIAGPTIVGAPTVPVQDSEPIIVPTEAEAAEASPNIASGGAIDLSELANMSDAAFDTMSAENVDQPAEQAASPAPVERQILTEEEIAANEAQARAASEANLAEASASMQNMHQNIMADIKPKEKEEVAQASIASKSRRRIKLSKKAIAIIIVIIVLLAVGGTLAYLIISGFFHTKTYAFGNWMVKIDESAYDVDSSNVLKLTAKDKSHFINYADIGELDHTGLLKDSSGMKSMFAEDGYKIESSNEEINGVVACAVYKLIDRNNKNNVVYTAYCNIGENMFSITTGANNTDSNAARSAFDKSIDIIRNAKRK